MTTNDPQTVVGEFMKAIAEERYDDAGALLHAEFVVHEAGGMPFSGEYHGPQGFFDLYAKMNEGLKLTPGEAIQYLHAQDTVAMRFPLKFTARASGNSLEMNLVEVYTVRGGLIVDLDVYYKDPLAITELLEA